MSQISELFRKDLVEKLLSYPLTVERNVHILVGQLPSLGLNLPLPENTTVIASVLHTKNLMDIFLDIPRTLNELDTFFINRLRSEGWFILTDDVLNDRSLFLRQPGFKRIERISFLTRTGCLNFFNVIQKAYLSIGVEAVESSINSTCLSLSLEIGGNDFWSLLSEEIPRSINEVPMPVLFSHQKDEISSLEGGGNPINLFSIANIKTELSRENLINHYKKQMIEVGWKYHEENDRERLYCSLWKLDNTWSTNWIGLLYLIQLEKLDEYSAYLRIISNDIYSDKPLIAVPHYSESEIGLPKELALRLIRKGMELDGEIQLESEQNCNENIPNELFQRFPFLQDSKVALYCSSLDQKLLIIDTELDAQKSLSFYTKNLRIWAGWSVMGNIRIISVLDLQSLLNLGFFTGRILIVNYF